ncbi:MAG: Gfo/Idh/MocA family oxidoreductase [Elusimicrobia bacterium]|nr:Gfo/Idh/MocA family oxidoreductase [Elusimicrobiota bacterium]
MNGKKKHSPRTSLERREVLLAQIGCGYWGPNLLRVFQEIPGSKVKWLCDLKPGRRAWALERYPHLKASESAEAALRDPEVDAVIVATEVVTHFPIARAALKAGKHVFIEKPMAHSSAEARELARLAAQKKLCLGVGHVFLYHPAVKVLQESLVPSKLGRPLYMDMVRVNPGPPEPKHDVIWDMAPHDAALALALAGSRPLSVRATGRRYLQERLDEAAFIEIAFTRGVVARIHVSWLSSRRIRRVEVYAEKGSAFYDDVEPFEKVRLVFPGKDTRVGAAARGKKTLYYGAGDISIPALLPDEPLRKEAMDFLDAIRAKRQPLSGPEIGVRVVEILEAACRSAAGGGKTIPFK